jgi:glycosyltransferase involved in cell wall biosynthesis
MSSKRSDTDRASVLLVTPHLDPTLAELQRLLAERYSVELHCSDAPEAQGARTRGTAFRFYWLDPLATMASVLPRLWRYDFVVNYYHRNGYWLGLMARLRARRKRPKLVWVGFAPNPRINGLVGHLREVVTYNALLGHDLIICNTSPVIDAIGRRFPKAAGRLAYARWGGTGDDDLESATDEGYIFTGGRTNRDFKTAFEALATLGHRAIIAAGEDVEFPAVVPAHISIVRDISSDEFQRLVQGARIVVVALKNPEVSSGQVVLNRAMRSGKPVVITATAGIDEYVTDGEDALFVAPGDPQDLADRLAWLLKHHDAREELGRAARRTYETTFNSRVFARELFDRFEALAKSTVVEPDP